MNNRAAELLAMTYGQFCQKAELQQNADSLRIWLAAVIPAMREQTMTDVRDILWVVKQNVDEQTFKKIVSALMDVPGKEVETIVRSLIDGGDL